MPQKVEQNSEWKIDGEKWIAVFTDLNKESVLCVNFDGDEYQHNWFSICMFKTPWREPYKHVTKLWIAEGRGRDPLRCKFTGMKVPISSHNEFPGAKLYRITTEEIL